MDPPPAAPAVPGSFDDLPGNNICYSCNFAFGLLILLLEIPVCYALTYCVAKRQKTQDVSAASIPATSAPPEFSEGPGPIDGTGGVTFKGLLRAAFGVIGWALAIAGWLYWFLYFMFYWNFISYLLLIGPALVAPAILISHFKSAPSPTRCRLLAHRIKLAGWTMGLLMLVLFQDVTILPSQLSRHLNKSEATITPNHPLVLQLRDKFYSEYPKEKYDAMKFVDQMAAVDKFIYRQITWKSDMEQYHVLGLLTTPEDVLTRMAGDCQGQSAVTASLLFALGGVQAYCVETPFHWWTHAVSNQTGETYNLNSHGGGVLDGSVLPQPVGMMYTWYPPQCEEGSAGCDDVTAHNRDPIAFLAPPHHAIMIAFTGMHEFRRDMLPPFANGGQWKLALMGGLVSVIVAAYSSCFQLDCCCRPGGCCRTLKRLVVSLPTCVSTMLMLFFWGYVFYPVCMIHLLGNFVFIFTFVCSDWYNRLIGTPAPTFCSRSTVQYTAVELA